MTQVAEILSSNIIEREEYLVIEESQVIVTCHLDFNGEAFIVAKYKDESIGSKIKDIVQSLNSEN